VNKKNVKNVFYISMFRSVSERWNMCRWTGYLLVPVSGRVHRYQLRDGDRRVRVSAVCEQRDVP